MELPVQITFRNLEPSPVIEDWVRVEAEKLEKFYSHIIGCRVAIEFPDFALEMRFKSRECPTAKEDLVPEEGVEPTRPCDQRILRFMRLFISDC